MAFVRAFDDILTLAAVRKGGLDPLEALLPDVKSGRELAQIPTTAGSRR